MSSIQRTNVLFTGLLALALAGCSGSGSVTGTAQIRCTNGSSFCLVSCDLGCGAAGCALTEVAENQRLQFVFNQEVAPESVTVATFSLRTTSGEAPDGTFLVDGKTITFVPTIRVTNGVSSFGFRRNESYIVTVVGGSANGIRSKAGDVLGRSISCTVVAARGIIDEDNAPPIATLVAPSNLAAAPVSSTIVIRFSEVVDTTAFLSPVSASTPIHYVLRQTRIPAGSTERVCNIDSEALQIEGLPSISVEQVNGRPVTVISLRPSITLPGLACIEVQVTGDVRDLAGRAARESTFRFLTEASAVTDTAINEDFASDARQDQLVSGGVWSAGAHAANVGGDGRHGSFNFLNGSDLGGNVYQWSTDSQVIPASQTFDGQEATVLGGEFFFTDLSVPAGVTVRFVGANPVKLHVRGTASILGTIEASGSAIGTFNCRNLQATVGNLPVAGQVGSAGGPGGGRGGNGGDRCLNSPLPACNGRDGADLVLAAGHAFAGSAVGTGGRGSPIWPAHGTTTGLTGTFNIATIYNGNINKGGGGGGFSTAGGPGVYNGGFTGLFVPPTNPAGGVAFSLLPLPTPAPSSLQHFLIGGSGGGGGGSHPFCGANIAVAQFQNDVWKAGAGGTGGGGAVMVRAGNACTIGATGAINVRGGRGVTINGDNPATGTLDVTTSNSSFGIAAPGGGGSGGSVLLQSGKLIQVDGALDARGGVGSNVASAVANTTPVPADARGGDGATGFYRLEAPGAVSVSGSLNFPTFDPALHRGALTDRDSVSGARSIWRNTGFVFPPTWLRYELQVDTNGDGTVDQIFSDDPSVPNSVGAAVDPLGPVRVRFQGARVAANGEPDVTTIRPWRDFVNDSVGVGINGDAATGFRFELLFNNDLFPNAVVRRLTVFVRG